MSLTKRNLLIALAALAASPALAQTESELDLSAGRAVGDAYRAAHPSADLSGVQALVSDRTLSGGAIESLRARARADFTAGRVFIHKGWRLSETEAQLFALLS